MLSAFEASGETYGSRRLSQAVTDLGVKIGWFKARRLMQELEIKAKCPKAKV
ncbi:IS3 family transposase [Mannheimia pernigra]|uniref:Transposase n=1 Tax=Mannheimia pernigra TaxID=111844 RepID=A0A7D5IEB8_9PAST|nr:IS3 family transposase [Mannheimia pernigra]QLB40655.1 transposase [Mannheimia pernigra]